jgi:hypothetical protein
MFDYEISALRLVFNPFPHEHIVKNGRFFVKSLLLQVQTAMKL